MNFEITTEYCSTYYAGPLSRDGSFGPSPVSGGAPSPPMMEAPVRPLSAPRREGPRGEFGKQCHFFLQGCCGCRNAEV